jgi:hypothetical protein
MLVPTPQSVVIEVLQQNTQTVWCVRLGKRAVTFHKEAAARAFAAQLHMRVQWLRKQAGA